MHLLSCLAISLEWQQSLTEPVETPRHRYVIKFHQKEAKKTFGFYQLKW